MYSYVTEHFSEENESNSEKSKILLNRRIYKLCDPSSPFIIVHYLSTSLKSIPLENSTSQSSALKEEDKNSSKKSSIPVFEEEERSSFLTSPMEFEEPLLFFDDVSPFGNYHEMNLAQKIDSLEEKIQKMQMRENQRNEVTSFRINDYTPEWDTCAGGAKLILCYTPSIDFSDSQVVIKFGEAEAMGKCIQPGVLKCFVPSHPPGNVKLSVFVNGTRVDDMLDKPSMFEFKEEHRKRLAPSLSEYLKERNTEALNCYKVRIVENLAKIDSKMANAMFDQSKEKTEKEIHDLAIAILSKLSTLESSKAEKILLESVDEEGLGLIHFIIILS